MRLGLVVGGDGAAANDALAHGSRDSRRVAICQSPLAPVPGVGVKPSTRRPKSPIVEPSGSARTAPATRTPGRPRTSIEQPRCRSRRPARASDSSAAGSDSRIVSTCDGSKPSWTRWSDHRLRSIRPAPTSSTTASAISTTTSALRKRWRRAAARRALRAVLERIGEIDPQRAQRRREAEDDAGDERDDRREQQDPQIDRDRGDARDARRIPPGRRSGRRRRRARDRATAATPVRTRLSVSSCRTTRNPLAPSAARTAISRWRPSARASSRFATLAQAISSRNATAPNSSQIARRTEPTTSSVSESTTVSNCICAGIEPFVGHRAGDAVQLVGRLLHRRAGLQPRRGIQPVAAVIHAGGIHLLRQPQLRSARDSDSRSAGRSPAA